MFRRVTYSCPNKLVLTVQFTLQTTISLIGNAIGAAAYPLKKG